MSPFHSTEPEQLYLSPALDTAGVLLGCYLWMFFLK